MPNAVLAVYSGKAVVGVFVHPFAPGGSIQISGVAELGLERLTVRPSITQLSMKNGMDGAVVPSINPGNQGEVEVEVWQTSSLHQQLLTLYNACKNASDGGDPSAWFAGTLYLELTTTGLQHNGTGVGIAKSPDVPYETDAGVCRWTLLCANLNSN